MTVEWAIVLLHIHIIMIYTLIIRLQRRVK